MSTRRPAAAATDHLFRFRGIVVTFRATALGGGVRVEVIGLDPVAIDEASARLARAALRAAIPSALRRQASPRDTAAAKSAASRTQARRHAKRGK